MREFLSPLPLTRRRFAAAAAFAPRQRRPNLLLLLAGGWRAQAFPAARGDLLAPGLDRLARTSLRFTRTYASCPKRTPSRVSLLTGRFPHSLRAAGTGRPAVPDEPTLLSELRRAGYSTGCIGEWGYDTGSKTRSAGEFIRANIPNDFCLLVALERPDPVPEVYARMYSAHSFELRENLPKGAEAEAREAYALYYAQCSAMDAAISNLLGVLETTGLTEDTIVVLTSDCGEMLGSHGLTSAGDPHEESSSVPLLIRYPRRLRGDEEREYPVSGVDLFPTLLGLCGAPVPSSIHGRDLSELILTGRGDPPESIYAEGALGMADEWRMLVRGLDKLVVDMQWRVTHLYNLGQDPFETTNLANAAAGQRKRDELLALLRRWVLRTGDRLNRR